MLIGVAGPYSDDSAEKRRQNLRVLNEAAARVFALGHIPVIGVNAALPVVECLDEDENRYEAIMAISLALMDKCDALLVLGDSPGVKRELQLLERKGLPIYRSISEIPAAS
jgi:hypothetical protein